jgi:hypothetical protein
MGALQNDQWDAAAEEKRFRESLQRARQTHAELAGQLSKSSPSFHLLSVAELDAADRIIQSRCFATRSDLLAELRRLIAEPTAPSGLVSDLQAYQASQKWWLQSMLQVYERSS